MGWATQPTIKTLSGLQRTCALLALFAVTAVLLAAASETAVAAPGKLLFSSSRSGEFDLWTINSDGSGLAQLTNLPGSEMAAKWSPDGTRIAFVKTPAGTLSGADVYVMQADGTGLRQMTHSAGAESTVSWSPDGKRLAVGRVVGSGADARSEIWIVRADGSGEQRFLDLVDNGFYPTWSPDGKEIAFAIVDKKSSSGNSDPTSAGPIGTHPRPGTGYTWQILSVDIEGTAISVLNGRELDGLPTPFSWSADSNSIFAVADMTSEGADAPEEGAIVRIGRNGSNFSFLSRTIGQVLPVSPAQSPDGSSIAYSRGPTPTASFRDIYVLPLNGGTPSKVTDSKGHNIFPDWRPLDVAKPATPNAPAPTVEEGNSSGLGQKVAPPKNAEKFCKAPRLKGSSLTKAKAMLKQSGCGIGKIKKPKSRGRGKQQDLIVISQSRKLGSTAAVGSKIDLKLGFKKSKKRR